MLTNQLERLQQDYVELDYFIQRLQKEPDESNVPRVNAFQKKQQYLAQVIQSMRGTQMLEQAI